MTYGTFKGLVILAILNYDPKKPFGLKIDKKLFSSKISLNHVTGYIFDLWNEFHEKGMKFGVFLKKIFF